MSYSCRCCFFINFTWFQFRTRAWGVIFSYKTKASFEEIMADSSTVYVVCGFCSWDTVIAYRATCKARRNWTTCFIECILNWCALKLLLCLSYILTINETTIFQKKKILHYANCLLWPDRIDRVILTVSFNM